MAYTERYVTSAAGGGGAGTSGDPWTLAEAFSSAVAGDRVNIQSDSAYSVGALTVTNAGSANSKIVFRGYNSSIGDLDGNGRTSTGFLDTTGFPSITVTGNIVPNVYVYFQNINVVGSINDYIIDSTSFDYFGTISCKLTNNNSGSSAACFRGDNFCFIINSDLDCTQSTHHNVVNADLSLTIIDSRINGEAAGETLISAQSLNVFGSTFTGSSTTIGINIEDIEGGSPVIIVSSTFYALGISIQTPNEAQVKDAIVVNCHITDNSQYLNNLYSATATHAFLELYNRTRDNTTPRTGIGNGLNIGEVTTDTGGAATDYVDASNGDITLIAAAPAVDAGMGM